MSDQLSYADMLRLYTTLGDERESSPSLQSEVPIPDSSPAPVARPLSRSASTQFPLHRDFPFTFAHDESFNDSPFTYLRPNPPGADLPHNMDNQAYPVSDQAMVVDVDKIQEMCDVAGLSYMNETYEVQNSVNTPQAHPWDTCCSTFEHHGPSSSGGDGMDENNPSTLQSNHKGKSRAASSPTRSQPFRPVLAPDNIPTFPPMESATAIGPNARGRPHAMPKVETSKDIDHTMHFGGVRKASKASSSNKRKRFPGRKLPSAVSSGVDVNPKRRNCKGKGRLGAVSPTPEMAHNASATVDESEPAESEAVEAVSDNVQSSDIVVASHSRYNLRRSSHNSQPTFAAGTATASTRGKRRRSPPPAASSSRKPPSTASSAVAASDGSDENSDYDELGPSSSAKKARLVTSTDTMPTVYAPFQRYVLNGQTPAARIVTCRLGGCRALLSHSHIDGAIHHWRGHFPKGTRNNGSEGNRRCPWRGCTERGAYSVLERHFFKEHFGVVFKCRECSYSCGRQSSFDLHLKKHHH